MERETTILLAAFVNAIVQETPLLHNLNQDHLPASCMLQMHRASKIAKLKSSCTIT